MCGGIASWHLVAFCLVLTWVGQNSVNGEPAGRPIWYNGPLSTSLVYQRAVNSAAPVHGESRAFPSPVFYAPTIVSSQVKSVPAVSTTTTTTEATPKSVKKYDVLKFFEKLRRINEHYANPNMSFGTDKQLNGDMEEESHNSRVDFIRSEIDGDDDEADDNNGKEADSTINEGMLIVTKMCHILGGLTGNFHFCDKHTFFDYSKTPPV